MAKTDFDNELQKKFAEEPLPFNEQHWQKLQARLDKKERRLLLLPFLPVAYSRLAAAASVIFVIVAVWLLQPGAEKDIIEKDITVVETLKADVPDAFVENNAPAITAEPKAVVRKLHKPIPIDAKHNNVCDKPDAVNEQKELIAGNAGQDMITEQQRKLPERAPGGFNFNELPKQYKSNMSLVLNGGLTFVESGRGFQAGIAIKNNISHNISIETSVSYLHGSQHVISKNERIKVEEVIMPSDTGSYQAYDTTIITWYNGASRNLPYAQLATSMSLRLHKKLNVSLGPDLQKVLLTDDNLASLNKQLSLETKKVPAWDFGVGMRIQYALTNRIGCGLSYRESITGLVNPGDNYINRDYVLFQLQYVLVR